ASTVTGQASRPRWRTRSAIPDLALFDVLSPCPTWNQVQTEAFRRERARRLLPDYDPPNRAMDSNAAIRDEACTMGVPCRRASRIEVVSAAIRASAETRPPAGGPARPARVAQSL
ncbi:MAG TPA: hypothetical protein VLH79_09125, partial [Chthonomonadales bacterium]|nr:hypothetical protein [Chthonomonadales bacterium]